MVIVQRERRSNYVHVEKGEVQDNAGNSPIFPGNDKDAGKETRLGFRRVDDTLPEKILDR